MHSDNHNRKCLNGLTSKRRLGGAALPAQLAPPAFELAMIAIMFGVVLAALALLVLGALVGSAECGYR